MWGKLLEDREESQGIRPTRDADNHRLLRLQQTVSLNEALHLPGKRIQRCLHWLEPLQLAQIRNALRQVGHLLHKGDAVAAEFLVVGHDEHLDEEPVDRLDERAQ